jgi:hypothetical protein
VAYFFRFPEKPDECLLHHILGIIIAKDSMRIMKKRNFQPVEPLAFGLLLIGHHPFRSKPLIA